MISEETNPSLLRHSSVVTIACLFGASSLVAFRVLVELGFGPRGGLRIAGLPHEYIGLTWFLALWALESDSANLSEPARLRGTLYQWWLSILAVAGTIWLVDDLGSWPSIRSAALVYWIACGCWFSVFLSAASIQRNRIGVARGVFPDAVRILGRPTTWVCAIAAISVLAAAPRSSAVPTGGRAFLRWYSMQPRQTVPESWRVRPVTLVELTDYQCPVCREAAIRYKDMLSEVSAKYGDSFAFIKADFPLERECNSSNGLGTTGGLHQAACEAAAAVRLARIKSPAQESQVTEWLWEHQRALTRELVFDGISRHFGLDVRAHYDELLPVIAREAAQGRQLRVTGTPTFFLNGRRLPLLDAAAMRLAITAEIEQNIQETSR